MSKILKLLRSEPAVVAGVVGSVIEAALSPDWKVALPIAIGIVIRQFVTPTVKADAAP